MHTLGKVGFHAVATRTSPGATRKPELSEYLTELSGEAARYMRPNFWPNTPDILHAYLQYGGPAAFKLRAVLAAHAVAVLGRLLRLRAVRERRRRPGSEEYLDNEKYQYRPRDWAATAEAGRIAPYLTGSTGSGAQHPALQRLRNINLPPRRRRRRPVYSRRLEAHLHRRRHRRHRDRRRQPGPARRAGDAVHLDMPALGMGWADDVRGARPAQRGQLPLGRARLRPARPVRTTPPTCCTSPDQVGAMPGCQASTSPVPV